MRMNYGAVLQIRVVVDECSGGQVRKCAAVVTETIGGLN